MATPGVVGIAQVLHEEAVAATLSAVIEQVSLDREAVATVMRDAIIDEVPRYQRAVDETMLSDVRSQCLHHLALMHAVLNGERTTDAEIDIVRAWAVDRASRLVPLESLLHAVRVAHRVARHAIVDAVPPGESGVKVALCVNELTVEYVDRVSLEITAAYAEHERATVAESDRLHRQLLEGLVAGDRSLDEHPLLGDAGLRGVRTCITVIDVQPASPDHGDVVLTTCARSYGQALVSAGRPAIVTVMRDRVVALVAPGSRSEADLAEIVASACRELATVYGYVARGGVSLAMADLVGVGLAHQEASRALSHAAPGEAHRAAEVDLIDHLTASADVVARRLALSRLPSTSPGETDFSSTIDALWRCDLNLTRTADDLGMHVNSIRHRVDRIQAISGRDPRVLAELVELRLALKIAKADALSPSESS